MKSDGFDLIGTLTTCSGCDSSIKRMKLFDSPMARTSDEMTRETMGAGGSNWTGSSSNIGDLTDSGPANCFPSYLEGKLTRQTPKVVGHLLDQQHPQVLRQYPLPRTGKARSLHTAAAVMAMPHD